MLFLILSSTKFKTSHCVFICHYFTLRLAEATKHEGEDYLIKNRHQKEKQKRIVSLGLGSFVVSILSD